MHTKTWSLYKIVDPDCSADIWEIMSLGPGTTPETECTTYKKTILELERQNAELQGHNERPILLYDKLLILYDDDEKIQNWKMRDVILVLSCYQLG